MGKGGNGEVCDGGEGLSKCFSRDGVLAVGLRDEVVSLGGFSTWGLGVWNEIA